jgi:protein-tyrosine phosphatase
VVGRDLAWEGCLNVRDLGGLATEDGAETRFGSVIRADTLGLLTREGWEALVAAGVTRIVDLREQVEIEDDLPRELEVEVVHVPVFDRIDEQGWEEIRAASAAAPSHAAATELVYLRFLEHCGSRFADAVAAVACTPGAVVVHCHGGKDRTGLVTAMLLRLARVPIETIADDYAYSAVRLQPRLDQWFADAVDDEERARLERIAATPREAMKAVLAALDDQYGGVDSYLVGGGLAPDGLAAARSRLR